ncbi:deaminase domain-containing protein [Gilliamella sp. wkB112]|uniref:deaminase domain-containing protein n=1 Tax=Gilliamella sp. wkB112 TaxID=3120257 RepID=UPI003FA5D172
MEDIGSRITGAPNTSGTINLHSELHICKSSSGVIDQFMQRFPNIIVNVTSR